MRGKTIRYYAQFLFFFRGDDHVEPAMGTTLSTSRLLGVKVRAITGQCVVRTQMAVFLQLGSLRNEGQKNLWSRHSKLGVAAHNR